MCSLLSWQMQGRQTSTPRKTKEQPTALMFFLSECLKLKYAYRFASDHLLESYHTVYPDQGTTHLCHLLRLHPFTVATKGGQHKPAYWWKTWSALHRVVLTKEQVARNWMNACLVNLTDGFARAESCDGFRRTLIVSNEARSNGPNPTSKDIRIATQCFFILEGAKTHNLWMITVVRFELPQSEILTL